MKIGAAVFLKPFNSLFLPWQVSIVEKLLLKLGPDANLAEHLVQFALVKILRRLQVEEPDLGLKDVDHLTSIPPGGSGRRGLHDDITVTVLVFDQSSLATVKPPSKWGIVRHSIFGLKKNLSQNRLLKWYSAIDEMLDHKDEPGFDPAAGDPDEQEDGPDAVIVKSKTEYDEQEYVLSGDK